MRVVNSFGGECSKHTEGTGEKLMKNKRILILLAASLTPMTAYPQFTLSGMAMYTATADGGWSGSSTWNTRGADFIYNIYMFTGTVASPFFLNNGDSDAALNPNLNLAAGTNVIQFTGETAPGGNLGINLYFN